MSTMTGHQPSHPVADREHPFVDAGQIILVIFFLVVWITDSFIFRWTTFLSRFVPVWLTVLVGILFLCSSVILSRTHVAGHSRSGNVIVTNGPYRLMRHPVYASVLLILFGLTILTMSILGFVVWVLTFLFYDFIARYEEAVLLSRFGNEYKDYMNHVPRWIPGIKRLSRALFQTRQNFL